MKEQTEEICLLAVKREGTLIRYIKNQTPLVCQAAINHNPHAKKNIQ